MPETERVRRKLQEEAIARVNDANSRWTPVITREDAERFMATKEDQNTAQISLCNERLAGLEGHLFGRDGTNGAFGELRSDIKAISTVLDQMHADMHKMSERHVSDLAKIDARLEKVERDNNNLGNSQRFVKRVVIAAFATVGASGLGAALWAGIRVLI